MAATNHAPPPPSTSPTASPSDSRKQSATEDAELLRTVHLLLGSKLRVTMTDGRVARGNFACLDRLGNIVLENVVEHRKVAYVPPSSSEKGGEHDRRVYEWDTERSLSQAVILGDRLAKVEIAKTEWRKRVGKGAIL